MIQDLQSYFQQYDNGGSRQVLIDLCDADLSGKAYWYPLYVQHTPPETHLQPSAAVKRIVNQVGVGNNF